MKEATLLERGYSHLETWGPCLNQATSLTQIHSGLQLTLRIGTMQMDGRLQLTTVPQICPMSMMAVDNRFLFNSREIPELLTSPTFNPSQILFVTMKRGKDMGPTKTILQTQ
jgi:hypothetical protein